VVTHAPHVGGVTYRVVGQAEATGPRIVNVGPVVPLGTTQAPISPAAAVEPRGMMLASQARQRLIELIRKPELLYDEAVKAFYEHATAPMAEPRRRRSSRRASRVKGYRKSTVSATVHKAGSLTLKVPEVQGGENGEDDDADETSPKSACSGPAYGEWTENGMRRQRTDPDATEATLPPLGRTVKVMRLTSVPDLARSLAQDFQISGIDEAEWENLFEKYDEGDVGQLDLETFKGFFRDLLLHIRDKHFEPQIRFRRDFFFPNDPSKQSIEATYDLQEQIGSGRFGVVIKARHRQSGVVRCVKKVPKSHTALPLESIVQELTILRKLDHPNIIRMVEAFEDATHLYLMFELFEGKELLTEILERAPKEDSPEGGGSFTETEAAQILKSILSALAHCHEKRIMHKDLKPENVMILHDPKSVEKAGGSLKIIDFGLSELFTPEQFSSVIAGTPYYMAPEMFMRRYNYKCDMWSVGVILYMLLTSYLPFNASSQAEYAEVVKTKPVPFPANLFDHISIEAKDLIGKLLQKDFHRRPSPKQALQHPWFHKFAGDKDRQASRKASMRRNRIDSALFQSFAKKPMFHRLCVNLLTPHLDYTSISRAPDVFKALDIDHDGVLSEQEISEALSELGMSEAEIPMVVDKLDMAQSGTITYSEFTAILASATLHKFKDRLPMVFTQFDRGNKGYLTEDDLIILLSSRAIEMDEQQSPTHAGHAQAASSASVPKAPEIVLRQIFKEVDTDGDGHITYQDFEHYLIHT